MSGCQKIGKWVFSKKQSFTLYLLLLCLIQLFLTSCFMLTVYINYHIVHPVAYIGDFQNPQYFWGICKLNCATQIEISKLISRSCKFSNCAEHTCTYIKATVYWMHRLPITVMCHNLHSPHLQWQVDVSMLSSVSISRDNLWTQHKHIILYVCACGHTHIHTHSCINTYTIKVLSPEKAPSQVYDMKGLLLPTSSDIKYPPPFVIHSIYTN